MDNATLIDACCLKCGHQLRDLPAPVCPKCGRPFDPADPRTFRPLHEREPWEGSLAILTGLTFWTLYMCGPFATGGYMGILAVSLLAFTIGLGISGLRRGGRRNRFYAVCSLVMIAPAIIWVVAYVVSDSFSWRYCVDWWCRAWHAGRLP